MNRYTLTGFVALGMVSASANAATLSLRWQGTSSDKMSLANSETATIEVVVDGIQSGDSLSTVFFAMEAIGGNPVTHLSNSTDLPGWGVGDSVNLPFGLSQFAAASTPPLAGFDLFGPIPSVVIGSFDIHFDRGLLPQTEWEIAFSGSNVFDQLLTSTGQFWNFTPNTGSHAGYASYSGYWTYGKGSPGGTQMSDAFPRDPLILSWAVPEPTSIALLIAGGFAAFMRRR